MTGPVADEVARETGSGTDLWRVIAAPVVWALHFLISYVVMAVACQKAGEAGFATGRLVVLIATGVALAAILWTTRRLWQVRGRSVTDNDFEFEHNTVEERHRFMSHVALMLCGLSAVGVIYVALPVVVLAGCR